LRHAGVQTGAAATQTAEGYETTFGVNHLAQYLLSRLLLPDLRIKGHIVFVSSGTHDPNEKTGLPEPRYTTAREIAVDFETGTIPGRRRCTTSKLCNIYCTYEFARRLAAASDPRLRSIRVSAFDPGMMPGTGLARSYPAPLRFVWNYVLPTATFFMRNVHSPAKSGKRLAALVMNPSAVSGKYYSDGRKAKSSELSYNKENAAELWRTSANMVGLPEGIA
jgi:NAD(P)-dependent dehydrogenase (short-subunit alcohol dehydrogenase family)